MPIRFTHAQKTALVFMFLASVIVSLGLVYAQGTLKAKEVRTYDGTEAKLCMDTIDEATSCDVELTLGSGNLVAFYTSANVSNTITFTSSTWEWMSITTPAAGPSVTFPRTVNMNGSFNALVGGSISDVVNFNQTDANTALQVLSSDSNLGVALCGDGYIEWGDAQVPCETGTNDTNLYRAAANSLKTDDDLTVGTLASCDHIQTDANGKLSCNTAPSEKAWSFLSPTSAGTYYYGGFYDFGASANDFHTPSITHGTANSSYAAHMMFVCAAGGSGGTDTVVRITGTSITDAAVRDGTPDTQDITMDDAGAAGAFYESSKKWIGQVTLAWVSGPDLLCNYGWAKYWDNNNTDFTVSGLETTWLGGGVSDSGFDVQLLHHNSAGWTYNAGAVPTPPTALARLQTDHNTEFETVAGEYGAWKRSDLATAVSGSASEGTIWAITTTAGGGRTIEMGNILMRITQ